MSNEWWYAISVVAVALLVEHDMPGPAALAALCGLWFLVDLAISRVTEAISQRRSIVVHTQQVNFQGEAAARFVDDELAPPRTGADER